MPALEVDLHDPSRAIVVDTAAAPNLADGEIALAIERVALTANTVTYAVLGERMHYWRFYPTGDARGRVPAWGYGEVIASCHPAVAVGERLYGFLPIASHATLRPGPVGRRGLVDTSPHREGLPAVYQAYERVGSIGERPLDTRAEDVRALLHPLFATAWLLADFLIEREVFGARRALLTSASSRTAQATAVSLAAARAAGLRLVGLTAPARVAAVAATGLYDEVVGYDAVDAIDADAPAVLLDYAGSASLRERLHRRLAAALRHSAVVGVTHHDDAGGARDLPGPRPELFFAPAQYARRREQWGAAVVDERLAAAWDTYAGPAGARLSMRTARGADAIMAAWQAAVDGSLDPGIGQMLAWS
jgi:hypothetical protein